MLQLIFVLSLIITGIHVSFLPGNALSPVRVFIANKLDKYLGKKWSRIIQKPLWDCLPCMASVWGAPICLAFLQDWRVVLVVLATAGLNRLIETVIVEEEEPVIHKPVEGFKRNEPCSY